MVCGRCRIARLAQERRLIESAPQGEGTTVSKYVREIILTNMVTDDNADAIKIGAKEAGEKAFTVMRPRSFQEVGSMIAQERSWRPQPAHDTRCSEGAHSTYMAQNFSYAYSIRLRPERGLN